ncbi:CCKAR [Mytilus edulis]|uniref:CCKAR n=1 Tax=Mytilus edulis TaxID=6550 RepID=A0A8S3V6E5_MYTED|nr:CCKAR [Mytilus edulis]
MNSNVTSMSEDFSHRSTILYWNEQIKVYLTPNTILLSIFLLIGVPGNLAVIFIYQCRLSKKTSGRYFIVPLAWTDTFALLVTGAINITQNTRQVTFPGFGTCKLLIYMSYVSISISLDILVAIAVQRYLKICRPFGRQMILTWRRRSVYLCILVSVLTYIPVLFYFGRVEGRNPNLGNVTGYQCSIIHSSKSKLKWFRIFQGFGAFATFCVVIIVTVLYILITKVIITHERKRNANLVHPGKQQTTEDILLHHTRETNTRPNITTRVTEEKDIFTKTDQQKSTFRISFMFMTISLVGFLAYLPSWSFIFIEANNPLFWKNMSSVSFHICLTLRRMYMVNHLCNPFIYGVFDKAFRVEVKKLFGKQ